MVKLQRCEACEGHQFVVLTGEWRVWGENQLRAPLTLLCAECGAELLTATWLGNEEKEPSQESHDEEGRRQEEGRGVGKVGR